MSPQPRVMTRSPSRAFCLTHSAASSRLFTRTEPGIWAASFALVMLRTLYAKWLYRKSAAERIRRIRAEFPDAAQRRAVLSAQGGVSIAGVIGAFVLLMVLGACATVLMGPNLDALAGML